MSRQTGAAHPPALYVLFFTEMWERFSYYGMRSLLMLYMLQARQFTVAHAGAIYGLYTGLVYLTPLAGGYLADRSWGQKRAIWAGGLLMAIGHFVLALPYAAAFYPALALLVIGNGLFKPNISVIVGQLYAVGDRRREAAFSLFYMGINLGAVMSPLICGTLGQRVGWHYGFGAAGVGMLIGLAIFARGQRHLQQVGLAPLRPPTAAQPPSSANAQLETSRRVVLERLLVLLALALFGNVIFWAAFEQAGSSMTLFAEQATQLELGHSGWSLPSSWLLAVNPAFIALLTPAFTRLWLRLEASGHEPAVPLKFALGLTLVAAGFAVLATAGYVFDQGHLRVSIGWLLVAYFLHTCGELCVSPVGLSAVTRLAPTAFVSLLMGFWFASMAVANLLGGALASDYGQLAMADFFAIPALLAAFAALLLLVLARPLTRMMHGLS